jgi:hypothetical protein
MANEFHDHFFASWLAKPPLLHGGYLGFYLTQRISFWAV